MRRSAYKVALGGILAALAMVIMTMGALIPVATYVCPMLCCLLLCVVSMFCGKRIGWAWYGVVSFCSILLSPDKEAAAIFLGLGFYPLIKPYLDRVPLNLIWKALFFNTVTLLTYTVYIYVFGVMEVLTEIQGLGFWGLIITLLLGNICFYLLDRLLIMLPLKFLKQAHKFK